MNQQLRRLFIVILVIFAFSGLAVANSHFFQAPSLNANGRNERAILHVAETDHGPIIVNGTAIASSSKMKDSQRFQRSYANGPLYMPITGYFSPTFSQATGLEATTESVLDGQVQALLAQRLRSLSSGANRQGGGLILTIDPAIQEAEAVGLGEHKGAVVTLNAKTGAVLALYPSPSYDPNAPAAFDTAVVEEAHRALFEDANDPLVNHVIGRNRYAPDSALKILTLIALLENDVANPDTPLDSPISTLLSNTEANMSNIESQTCGDRQPTLSEAFARSCSTSFVIASQSLAHRQLTNVATHFGFGSAESISLSVTSSIFPEQIDTAQFTMSSIGQSSVQVTPMQMAHVAQVIMNKGALMRPYLISQVVSADLVVRSQTSPVSARRAATPETAQPITEMMKGVVSAPYGTGQSMVMGNTQVTAKTGAAGTGVDGKANTRAVGFMPTDDPQIAFMVIVEGDDADPAPHGSDVVGPIARSLLEARLR